MSIPKYWREIPQRYRLEASKCKKCGKIFFPPRLICSNCKSQEFESIRLKEEGEIVTYTIIRVPPKQFTGQSPYPVAIVELDDGVRIMGQITDANSEDVEIGKKVRVVFRKIQEQGHAGIINYGYKFILK